MLCDLIQKIYFLINLKKSICLVYRIQCTISWKHSLEHHKWFIIIQCILLYTTHDLQSVFSLVTTPFKAYFFLQSYSNSVRNYKSLDICNGYKGQYWAVALDVNTQHLNREMCKCLVSHYVDMLSILSQTMLFDTLCQSKLICVFQSSPLLSHYYIQHIQGPSGNSH